MRTDSETWVQQDLRIASWLKNEGSIPPTWPGDEFFSRGLGAIKQPEELGAGKIHRIGFGKKMLLIVSDSNDLQLWLCNFQGWGMGQSGIAYRAKSSETMLRNLRTCRLVA